MGLLCIFFMSWNVYIQKSSLSFSNSLILSHRVAISAAKLSRLADCLSTIWPISATIFDDEIGNRDHKLLHLLPSPITCTKSLRCVASSLNIVIPVVFHILKRLDPFLYFFFTLFASYCYVLRPYVDLYSCLIVSFTCCLTSRIFQQ